MQFALLLEHGPQHLLQQRRVVRQGVGVDLHTAMMNQPAASKPETMSTKCEIYPANSGRRGFTGARHSQPSSRAANCADES